MIPTIPAEWPSQVDLSQKLPMSVSRHDILMGVSVLNQGSTCKVIKAQMMPFFVLMDNSLFSLNNCNVHVQH